MVGRSVMMYDWKGYWERDWPGMTILLSSKLALGLDLLFSIVFQRSRSRLSLSVYPIDVLRMSNLASSVFVFRVSRIASRRVSYKVFVSSGPPGLRASKSAVGLCRNTVQYLHPCSNIYLSPSSIWDQIFLFLSRCKISKTLFLFLKQQPRPPPPHSPHSPPPQTP